MSSRSVLVNAFDSIPASACDSNEIDESDQPCAKQHGHRISILHGIVTSWEHPGDRSNIEPVESRINDELTMKGEFPASIEISIPEIFKNAEQLNKSTPRGILIDLRAET
jgi:hypothetical protein